jgi:pimeloyl-ACP methyl ester carboxylesterase
MVDLADDIAMLLDYFGIRKAHAVIGVSQGGAAVLQFSIRHPERSAHIIVCDTQAKAPKVDIVPQEQIERAKRDGMGVLAYEIAAQWFPPESPFHPSSGTVESKSVLEMISSTPVLGFEAGARSLRDYDLFAEGLLQNKVKTLLIVGDQDTVLREGMKLLQKDWFAEGGDVKFAMISGSGHIPILDGAERWSDVVTSFLER